MCWIGGLLVIVAGVVIAAANWPSTEPDPFGGLSEEGSRGVALFGLTLAAGGQLPTLVGVISTGVNLGNIASCPTPAGPDETPHPSESCQSDG